MANSIFDLSEFKPYQAAWNARVLELTTRAAYYDGSIYQRTMGVLGWLAPRLGKSIKPLYLPLARAVDVDAGIIPGGWALAEDAPEAWANAMKTLFDSSRWQTEGVLYVHYGALYGVSGLKVVDDRAAKRIELVPCDPTHFMLVAAGQYTPENEMVLWIEKRTDEDGDEFEYAEVTTSQTIRTFADGAPAGFDGREPEYVNDLNALPVFEPPHIHVGDSLGECTYQKAIPLLDLVNEQASSLAEIIRKHAEPQWMVSGAEASDLEHSGNNIWFVPSGGDAKILVPGIDIDGVLEFVREIRDQVYGALPELAFDELRKKDQIATATLELQLMELVLKVKRTRPNYDAALVSAMQLAGVAAKQMKLPELAALDDPALTLDAERAILPLDPKTQLELRKLTADTEMVERQVTQVKAYP